MTTIKCPHAQHQTKVETPLPGFASLQYCRVCHKPIEMERTEGGTPILKGVFHLSNGAIATEWAPFEENPELWLQGNSDFDPLENADKREKLASFIKHKALEEMMLNAADCEDYETAALLRDKIKVLQG